MLKRIKRAKETERYKSPFNLLMLFSLFIAVGIIGLSISLLFTFFEDVTYSGEAAEDKQTESEETPPNFEAREINSKISFGFAERSESGDYRQLDMHSDRAANPNDYLSIKYLRENSGYLYIYRVEKENIYRILPFGYDLFTWVASIIKVGENEVAYYLPLINLRGKQKLIVIASPTVIKISDTDMAIAGFIRGEPLRLTVEGGIYAFFEFEVSNAN
ncbi:MAG: hypothetical protein Kow0090_19960 [Myxococcota bacterium]